MYNRYIPQSDGSFRRNQVPDQRQQPQQRQTPQPQSQSQRHQPVPPPAPPRPCEPEPVHSHPVQQRQQSPMEFLRKLLPKDFDTGDLLIVLLLLLMAGDCGEEQNTAILTLALYLFL